MRTCFSKLFQHHQSQAAEVRNKDKVASRRPVHKEATRMSLKLCTMSTKEGDYKVFASAGTRFIPVGSGLAIGVSFEICLRG
jgi:hypothetical protein